MFLAKPLGSNPSPVAYILNIIFRFYNIKGMLNLFILKSPKRQYCQNGLFEKGCATKMVIKWHVWLICLKWYCFKNTYNFRLLLSNVLWLNPIQISEKGLSTQKQHQDFQNGNIAKIHKDFKPQTPILSLFLGLVGT